jgi:hypothetical protein
VTVEYFTLLVIIYFRHTAGCIPSAGRDDPT